MINKNPNDMDKSSSITNRIKKEFEKKDTLTLHEIYSILSQYEEVEHISSKMKHKIRGSIYNMKKGGDLELIDKATYKIVK